MKTFRKMFRISLCQLQMSQVVYRGQRTFNEFHSCGCLIILFSMFQVRGKSPKILDCLQSPHLVKGSLIIVNVV